MTLGKFWPEKNMSLFDKYALFGFQELRMIEFYYVFTVLTFKKRVRIFLEENSF